MSNLTTAWNRLCRVFGITAVCVLLTSCVAMTERFEAAVTHKFGGITREDARQEVLRQHLGAASKQCLIIDSRVWQFNGAVGGGRWWDPKSPEKFKERPGDAGIPTVSAKRMEGGENRYLLDRAGSLRDALRIRDMVLAHYSSRTTCSTRMVFILCGEHEGKIYRLNNTEPPIYVLSRLNVDGGTPVEGSEGANLMRLTGLMDTRVPVEVEFFESIWKIGKSTDTNFPFEAQQLFLDRHSDINEIDEWKMSNMNKNPPNDTWLSADEVNAGIRANYLRHASVSWPRNLGMFGPDDDILWVSWKRFDLPSVQDADDKIPAQVKCARVSANDGIVYFYKTSQLERSGVEYGTDVTFRTSIISGSENIMEVQRMLNQMDELADNKLSGGVQGGDLWSPVYVSCT